MQVIVMSVVTLLFLAVIIAIAVITYKQDNKEELLNVLKQIAQTAVVFAEKQAVNGKLTGKEKFQVATNFANLEMTKLGFSKVDEQLIDALVEQAWAEAQPALTKLYQGEIKATKQANLKAKEIRLNQVADKLEADKEILDQEKLKVKSLAHEAESAVATDSSVQSASEKSASTSAAVNNAGSEVHGSATK